MANTSKSTYTSSTLGQWVEDFFDKAFCQPNDEVSATALNETLAQEFVMTSNHDRTERQEFIEMVKKFRLVNSTSVQSSKEIKRWDAPDGSGGGCLAQLMHFKDTNKETGVGTGASALLLANVQVIGGKKVLFSLTEVLNQGE